MTPLDIRARLQQALSVDGGGSSDFDLNPEFKVPEATARPAGVLVACVCKGDGADVILTKRSSALKHHPGQIAFPGGKVDPQDDGVIGAALREAQEEVGLPSNQVEVLGTLPSHRTVTQFDVTPVLAWVKGDFAPRPEPGEVDEVFRVPLQHVTQPGNFLVHGRRWRGHRRHYYAVPYGPYYIWGATARILRGLADRLS